MIGSDALGAVLGAAPVGDPERLPNIVRAMIRAGLSPVLMKPGTKETFCTLSATAAKKADAEAQEQFMREHPERQADRVRHACGLKHVLDDPAKVSTIVKRAQGIFGHDLNVGLHAGRSRVLLVDVDTTEEREAFGAWWAQNVAAPLPPITVESPGVYDTNTNQWVHYGGGHWYFSVPEGFVFPAGKVHKGPGGWAAMWGESYVLVPPSVRAEGPYRLVGTVTPAPGPLLEAVHTGAPLAERLEFEVPPQHGDNPIEAWSRAVGWDRLLTPDGWTFSGLNTDCGCPNYRAPGNHASSKSATAHQAGCKLFDTSTGWAPLKIWTDHPPAGLPPEGAVTLFDYVNRVHFGGDVSATKTAIGVPEWVDVPPVIDPLGSAGTGSGTRTIQLTRSSDMQMRTTRWSWIEMEYRTKWIPQGALTLLGGREGMGKSTLAYWIAAQITRGTLPGDNFGRPRSVIISATEDAWEQTVNPRLEAAGADRSRVFRADVRRADDLMEGLVLPTDVPAVRAICAQENVGLILLDPLLGSIGGKLDTHKDSEVRQALEPLSRLAHDAQVTVIGLIHENKSSQGDRLTKLMGSRAFSAVARAVLICAREDQPLQVDMATQPEPTFLFGQLKSNLGPKSQNTLRYRIREELVGTDPEFGDPIYSSRIEWIGRLEQGIESVLDQPTYRPDTPRGEAGNWILARVQEVGPSSRKELILAAVEAGHSKNTVERALDTLQAASPPQLVGKRDGRVVILSIPSGEDGE